MRSAIYGAGSLGTILGAFISKNGECELTSSPDSLTFSLGSAFRAPDGTPLKGNHFRRGKSPSGENGTGGD